MGHIDERAVRIFKHITIDNGFHQIAIAKIQTVKWLIKDKQIRRLHESARQQYQPLFTTRHLEEFAISQMFDAKDIHPFNTEVFLLLGRTEVKTDGIFKSAGHNLYGRDVLLVASVHLGRNVANMLFNVPDALS